MSDFEYLSLQEASLFVNRLERSDGQWEYRLLTDGYPSEVASVCVPLTTHPTQAIKALFKEVTA